MCNTCAGARENDEAVSPVPRPLYPSLSLSLCCMRQIRRHFRAAAAVCQSKMHNRNNNKSHICRQQQNVHGKVSARYKTKTTRRCMPYAASCPAQMPFAYHNNNNNNNNKSHRECCKKFRLISSTINQKIKSKLK